MKLITELTEEVSLIAEGTGADKKLYIEGIFLQSAVKNRNGRIYPESVMDNEVNRYLNETVNKGKGWGELGHPAGPQINAERICHRIVELRKEGTNYYGKALVTNTPYGEIVKGLLESGGSFGVSSRALGSLKPKNGIMEVQNDFRLSTAGDVVMDPSAPDAWVNGIMEGVDWVWNNGILTAQVVEEQKKEIQKATRVNLNETRLRVWRQALSLL